MRDWLQLQMPNAFPDPIPTMRAPQQLTRPRPQGTLIYMQILTPGVAPTTAHTHECAARGAPMSDMPPGLRARIACKRREGSKQPPLLASGGQTHACHSPHSRPARSTRPTTTANDTTRKQHRHAHDLTKAETILRAQQATTPHRDCQRQGRKSSQRHATHTAEIPSTGQGS